MQSAERAGPEAITVFKQRRVRVAPGRRRERRAGSHAESSAAYEFATKIKRKRDTGQMSSRSHFNNNVYGAGKLRESLDGRGGMRAHRPCRGRASERAAAITAEEEKGFKNTDDSS